MEKLHELTELCQEAYYSGHRDGIVDKTIRKWLSEKAKDLRFFVPAEVENRVWGKKAQARLFALGQIDLVEDSQ